MRQLARSVPQVDTDAAAFWTERSVDEGNANHAIRIRLQAHANAMNLAAIPANMIRIVAGAAILLAVFVDALRTRALTKR
jgi:hypothetical protein